MTDFEDFILSNPIECKSFHPYFEKALNEMIVAGGKRFRPELMFMIIRSFKPELLEKSYPIGLAIEIMHTYSLIHDDLPAMDNADLRRGHPTLHVTYDEVTGILVGDSLNTHAFRLITDADLNDSVKVKLVKELSNNAGIEGMALGQALDCFFEEKELSLEQLEFVHNHKTGKMISGALKMGAIICELSEEMQEKLFDFGEKLGLLFQVQDDILDIISSKDEAGKPVGHDEKKNTYVSLMGLDKAIEYADKLGSKCSCEIENFDEKLKENLKIGLEKYLFRHKKKLEVKN